MEEVSKTYISRKQDWDFRLGLFYLTLDHFFFKPPVGSFKLSGAFDYAAFQFLVQVFAFSRPPSDVPHLADAAPDGNQEESVFASVI